MILDKNGLQQGGGMNAYIIFHKILCDSLWLFVKKRVHKDASQNGGTSGCEFDLN